MLDEERISSLAEFSCFQLPYSMMFKHELSFSSSECQNLRRNSRTYVRRIECASREHNKIIISDTSSCKHHKHARQCACVYTVNMRRARCAIANVLCSVQLLEARDVLHTRSISCLCIIICSSYHIEQQAECIFRICRINYIRSRVLYSGFSRDGIVQCTLHTPPKASENNEYALIMF